ncbi:MAG: SIMPL domain-containing protein [Holosporales bacterium]|jgi:hypothetical protein|nr:SIMPL domain-containing protein [Holosporales bacterium]
MVGSSIIIGCILHSQRMAENNGLGHIQVEGTAEQEITADMLVMSIDYSTTHDNVKGAVDASKNAKKRIIEVLNNCGLVKDADYHTQPRCISQSKTTNSGNDIVTASQTIRLSTTRLAEAENAEKALDALASDGITATYYRSYEYKDMPRIEREMMGKAILDAYERAAQIARHTECEIIGAPKIGWGYVQLKDTNACRNGWSSTGGSAKEQTANMRLQVEYTVRKADPR